jgi:hypothetical protein
MLLKISFDWDYSPWLGCNLDAHDLSHGSSHMVCDWISAGRAQGTPDVNAWYI